MTAHRLLSTALAAVALAAAPAATAQAAPASAAPASAAPASASETVDAIELYDVAVGKLSGFAGNRHQLRFSSVDGNLQTKYTVLRSFYCPAGANITFRWASSRCTHRSTFKLKNAVIGGAVVRMGRLSTTGNSATLRGPVTAVSTSSSVTRSLDVDIRMYSDERTNWATGTFGNRPLQRSGQFLNFGELFR
ncbi:hypothetical protein [Janibacter sp. G368]|uniref:hypothetical protein n=1 Tax=Janibacter sp. G368 TaxID=3420441 RepID=UPI003D0940A3